MILGAIRIFLRNPKPALTPIFTVFDQVVSEIPNTQIFRKSKSIDFAIHMLYKEFLNNALTIQMFSRLLVYG